MELKAIARTAKGKLPEGYLPVVAYNKDQNITLAVEARAFDRVFRAQSTHGLVELAVEGGEPLMALVKNVQMDKRRRTPIHVDFYLATIGQEIQAPVPVHTSGQPRGVTEQGGILDIVIHNLAIVAPGPRRIPAELVVDVTHLAIGESIHAREIALPEGVRLAVDPDVTVVAVLPPQKIVEAEPTEAEVEAQRDVPSDQGGNQGEE